MRTNMTDFTKTEAQRTAIQAREFAIWRWGFVSQRYESGNATLEELCSAAEAFKDAFSNRPRK